MYGSYGEVVLTIVFFRSHFFMHLAGFVQHGLLATWKAIRHTASAALQRFSSRLTASLHDDRCGLLSPHEVSFTDWSSDTGDSNLTIRFGNSSFRNSA